MSPVEDRLSKVLNFEPESESLVAPSEQETAVNDLLKTAKKIVAAGIKPKLSHLYLALGNKQSKKMIELLLEQIKGPYPKTLLFAAVALGHPLDVIDLLIEKGCSNLPHCVRAAQLRQSKELIDRIEKIYRTKETPVLRKRKKELDVSYDYQLILNMRPFTFQAETLSLKAVNRGILSGIIPLCQRWPDDQFAYEAHSLITLLTHRSRVYIIAHGQPGADALTGELEDGVGHITQTYQKFCSYFQLAPQLKKRSKNKIKISLVVCYGATPTDRQASFAEKLSRELFANGIQGEVVARHGLSSMMTDGRKAVDFTHRKKESKFSFTTDAKGTQIKTIHYN